jgi:hypothetical protein
MSLLNSQKPKQWELIARSYTPPIKDVGVDRVGPDVMPKALFGLTTILLQDINSGEIRKEELLGSDENQLYGLLEKTAVQGIQYVNYNGKRFAIAEVPAEEVLPVK